MSIENTQLTAPPRKKLKRTLLYVAQIALGLLSFLFLVVLATQVYLWVGNINNVNNLVGSAFSFLLLLVCAYFIHLTEKALEEFRPRKKMNIEEIKQSLYSLLPSIIIFVSIYLLNIYFGLFPTTISATLSLEILKILIQTNGFLIGFSGIVFAQMFWAVHNQQANIQKDILEHPFVPHEKTVFDIREDYLEAFERKRKSLMIVMFSIITLFLVSILLSVSVMAQTETNTIIPTNPTFTNPFWFMVLGTLLFAVSLAQSKMDIRTDVIRILNKRLKTQSATIEKLKKDQRELKKELIDRSR